MEKLIDTAERQGYKHALRNVLLKETNPYVCYLAEEEGRADFSVLLDLDTHSKVLDIGCSWGAICVALARRCGEVYAVDSIIESLRFLQVRARQESLSNLHLARIEPLDFGKLPFSDSYFDAVLLNGVLEWIGSARVALSVEDVRRLALEEIKRILKPNGRLYIGIENRYSLLYMLGAIDHHGLPFTSLLPRYCSDWLMRLTKKRSYRTHTYSYRGYKGFLTGLGYDGVSIYMPLPTYHKPFYLISLDSSTALRYFWDVIYKKNDTPSLKRQMLFAFASKLKCLWIYRMFAPSFSIVAEKRSV